MHQEDALLWEIEKRGGRITTFELMDLHISQYQARLKGLREKLLKKNWILTEAEKISGYKRNYLYRLIKPNSQQMTFF